MEILIIGALLVALMAYASTKIKKRAAEAFEPELIETDRFSLRKPEGFLHVIGTEDHDFEAYSKEFGEGDFRQRRGKIELDIFRGIDLAGVRDSVRDASNGYEIVSQSDGECRVETDELANETPLKAFYRIVAVGGDVYRLRFAALSKHADDYSRTIDETLESFTIKTQ